MIGRFYSKPIFNADNRRWVLMLEVDSAQAYDKLKDAELDVTIKKHRIKRSLNANAYFHVLVDKLAEKMGLSHTQVHNMMIADWGQVDRDINNIIMDDDIPWERCRRCISDPRSTLGSWTTESCTECTL